MRLLSTIALSASCFLLQNCENLDSSLAAVNETLDRGLNGRAVVLVTDPERRPVAGVAVRTADGIAGITDSSGIAILDSIVVGRHLLFFEAAGFSSTYEWLSMELDSNAVGIPVIRQTTLVKTIVREGAKVSGRILSGDSSKALSGVEVGILFLEGSFVTSRRTTVSGPDGAFVFQGLPERTRFRIWADRAMVDNTSYCCGDTVTVERLSVRDSLTLPPILVPPRT